MQSAANDIEKSATEGKDDAETFGTHVMNGLFNLSLGNYEKALEHFKKAKQYQKSVNDTTRQGLRRLIENAQRKTNNVFGPNEMKNKIEELKDLTLGAAGKIRVILKDSGELKKEQPNNSWSWASTILGAGATALGLFAVRQFVQQRAGDQARRLGNQHAHRP